MSNHSGLISKIKSLQQNSADNNVSQKLETLQLFLSDHHEKYPELTAQIDTKNKIVSLVKKFFDSFNDIMFYKNHMAPKNFLAEKEFQQNVESIFSQFIKAHSEYAPKIEELKQSKPQAQDQDLTQSLTQDTPKQQKPQKHNVTYPKIDFIKFLQFWLEKDEHVQIFYEQYFDAVKSSVQIFQKNLYHSVSKQVSQINSVKQIKEEKKEQIKATSHSEQSQKQVKEPQSDEKIEQEEATIEEKPQENSIKSIKSSQQSRQNSQKRDVSSKIRPPSFSAHAQVIPQNNLLFQPKDSFHYYLRKFHDHYCKKYLNTIKNQEFEKLGDFYNSMNLTKFMQYVKDVKLLKLDKTITAKYLQQLFKAEENQKRCLEYDGFAKIVTKCLEIAFQTKDEIETKGYEYIGVFNRQNFAQIMSRLGVIVPLKKIVFSKLSDVKSISRLVKSRTNEEMANLKQSRDLRLSHLQGGEQISQGHGHESNWDSNKLHPDLFLNQKQRKQQRLLQSLTIPKLNKLQPSKNMDEKLHDMADDDYDPYLKRYNERNNLTNENASGLGMMKRIDERIQNVVKKIR